MLTEFGIHHRLESCATNCKFRILLTSLPLGHIFEAELTWAKADGVSGRPRWRIEALDLTTDFASKPEKNVQIVKDLCGKLFLQILCLSPGQRLL